MTKTDNKKEKIGSLAELRAAVQHKSKITLKFGNGTFSLEMRRLTPGEEAKLAEIMDSVVPPIIRGRVPEEDRLDLTNVDYIRRKTEAAIQARSLALYLAVEDFRRDRPDMVDPKAINQYIQHDMGLTESILDALWQATRKNDLTLADLTNFT